MNTVYCLAYDNIKRFGISCGEPNVGNADTNFKVLLSVLVDDPQKYLDNLYTIFGKYLLPNEGDLFKISDAKLISLFPTDNILDILPDKCPIRHCAKWDPNVTTSKSKIKYFKHESCLWGKYNKHDSTITYDSDIVTGDGEDKTASLCEFARDNFRRIYRYEALPEFLFEDDIWNLCGIVVDGGVKSLCDLK